MRIQNINQNNNYKQNFGAVIVSGEESVSPLLHSVALLYGVSAFKTKIKNIGDIFVLRSKQNSQNEENLLRYVKTLFLKSRNTKVETLSDDLADTYMKEVQLRQAS